MNDQISTITSVTRTLEQAQTALGGVPLLTREGFRVIGKHMENFSNSFATSSGRVISIQTRIATSGHLGLGPFREDLELVYHELHQVLGGITRLMEHRHAVSKSLEPFIMWGLELEQKACLPAIVDLVDSSGGQGMEQQAMGSIVDSLLQQTRPLVYELITTSQEAVNAIDQLARRVDSDMSDAHRRFQEIRKHNAGILERMGRAIDSIGVTCQTMEKRANQVRRETFSMVQAMQFDDITSQRITHVASALGKARELMLSNGQAANGPVLVTVQAARDQLADILNDLMAAVRNLHQHLSQVAELAVQQVSAVSAARDTGRAIQQDMADLSYNLNSLLRLGLLAEMLTSETHQGLHQAEEEIEQVERVQEALQRLNQELTRLLAKITPQGSQLALLKENITQMTLGIGSQREQRAETLATVREELGRLSSGLSRISGPQLENSTALLKRLPRTLRKIKVNNDDLIKVMNDTLGDAQAPAVQVMLLVAEMTFHTSARQTVERIADALAELIPALEGARGQSSPAMEEGIIRELGKLFTMESERRALQGTVARLRGERHTPVAEPESEQVELF